MNAARVSTRRCSSGRWVSRSWVPATLKVRPASASPKSRLSPTTSAETGQMVRLASFSTGSFMSPVMLATASTPASARQILVKLTQASAALFSRK